ncbi:MAG: tetrahydrofolate synthase [Acidobacteria bacterium]|nr:tetrahydrofolate synthase [Acidobacteriota bacterium]
MNSAPLLYLDSLLASGIRPGLGRMRALLRELGHPERAYPAVIVAGTNGKGSTSATLTSILRASGLRAALYTSPHLVDIRERWMIDGAPIEEPLLAEATGRLQEAAERAGITPTYFEALTLVAFIAFALARVEVAVLEVGMGGRLDATNVVRPLAALITPIGFDHMEFLGTTLARIAGEKAGVIHRGAVVLTSNDDPRVIGILRRRSEKFGNRFVVVDGEHDTPLAGGFQRRNAALAVRAAGELAEHFPSITKETIERGVAETRWRGRLERIDVGGKRVWVDGFHNAHALAAVAPFLERLPRPRLVVFGIMSDKDVHDVARRLFPMFDAVITTEPYPPRSMSAESLAELARTIGVRAEAEPEPRAALQRALASGEGTIVVGGSLYLAGAAIEFLDEQHRREQQP